MVDSILIHGRILTQDAARPVAEAMAIAGGRVVATGTASEMEALGGPRAERIDADGATVVPGFNDAHIHVWKLGALYTSVADLRGTRSFADLRQRLAKAASELPGEWLVARGLNELEMEEGRLPDRDDLDRIVPDRPLTITRTCGHIGLLNTRGLEKVGVGDSTPDPAGGTIVRDLQGRANGHMHETALGMINRTIPPPGPRDFEAMIRAASAALLEAGVTAVTEAGASPELMQVYRDLETRGELPLRYNVMLYRVSDHGKPYDLPEIYRSDRLRFDSVKLLADGGLSGGTAALHQCYRGTEDKGLLRLDKDHVLDLAREAYARGFRIATHAIGDRALDAVLGAYEELVASGPGPAPRIEHCGLPTAEHLARCARTRTILVPQAIFLPELGRNFRHHLPESMLRQVYPIRSMLNCGSVVALSSDAPVVREISPLAGLEAAVTRTDGEGGQLTPGEGITAAEGLRAYTLGGAEASGDQDHMGSLSPGRWADFVLLDRDPTAVPPEDLRHIRVLATHVAGRRVWSS